MRKTASCRVMLMRPLAILLLAGVALTQSAGIELDIPYGTAHAAQRLDLHLPAGRDFPVVVFFHGGSLNESGERRDSPMYAGVCPALAREGIACATVDYRLAPTHQWPAMPQDAASAVKWVTSNIASRGGDATRVFLFGHSSGCHLAAILGANPRFLAAESLTPRDIAGIVAMGCVLAPTDEALARFSVDEVRARWPGNDAVHPTADSWLDADPSRTLGPHMPPTLVLLADEERFFPAILEQGAKFARRLLELKRPADVVIVPGGHVSSISDFGTPDDPAMAAVLAFVRNPANAPTPR